MIICLEEGRYQISDISIMVICYAMLCYASDTIEYDRRTQPELSNAALHMKQDTTSIPVYQYRELSGFKVLRF